MQLLSREQIKEFNFFFAIPGLRAKNVYQAEALFENSEVREVGEDDLRRALQRLPCCTSNLKGTATGDPLNLVFIGDAEDLFPAFGRRHGHLAEETYWGSVRKPIGSFLFGERYRYSLHGTEQHILHSDAVGTDFEITVMPPAPELRAGPTPVVYGTDANLSMGMYADTVRLLLAGGEIPPVTLVGIGYPIGADFIQFNVNRTRDFTPMVDEWHKQVISGIALGEEVSPGGGPAFLEFLTNELRPWLTDHYDVADDHTYVGDSLGGFFGTYVLLNQPDAFQRYVIGSPWLAYSLGTCLEWEEKYAASHHDLNATVFYASGAAEDVVSPLMQSPMVPLFLRGNVAANTERMINRLRARNYASLRLTSRIYSEQTHFTVPPIIYAQGLREVLADLRLARS